MRVRNSAMRWSVAAVGVLVVGVSLAHLVLDGDGLATDGPEVAFPIACGLGTVALGIYLRELRFGPRQTGMVAALAVAGFAAFGLVAAWLTYVASLEGQAVTEAAIVVLNGAGFGALGSGLLAAAYVSMRAQRAALERQRGRLRRANDQLRRQNERLESFADTVAHDLRNPLNVASGRLALARMDGDPEPLESAARAISRAEAILEDMLTLARRGQTVDEAEPVDLEAVSRAAWGTVSTGDVTLEVAAPVLIRADESRLRQLLENLFRNAIEHGGDGVSTVRVGQLDGEGYFVADDGGGVPSEVRASAFESGVTTATDGTGFGLAIVSAIADAHGWDVAVTDERGGGARFEVTGVEVEAKPET